MICFLITGGINAQVVVDQNASRDNLIDSYLKSGNYYFKDTPLPRVFNAWLGRKYLIKFGSSLQNPRNFSIDFF